ncbi:MAG: hypothetical protein LC754_19380 [Acidobacteria bacterium]|nr:hypothetical protein [Acidobacteriota bacterium]
MKKLFSAVCFLAICMFGVQNASACECNPIAITAWGELQASDVVFTGQVVDVREIQIPFDNAGRYTIELEVKFRVKKNLKGIEGKEVVLRSNPGFGGDCGIRFKKGEKYLVYANQFNGRLQTSGCTRTKLMKHAAPDFKEIEEGVELKVEQGQIIKSFL